MIKLEDRKIDDMYEHYEGMETLPAFSSYTRKPAALVFTELLMDKTPHWQVAREKYKHLLDGTPYDKKLYSVIHTMAYLNDIMDIIDWRTKLYHAKDKNTKLQLKTFLKHFMEPNSDTLIEDFNPHWIDIYRAVRHELEYIIDEFATEKYLYLNEYFHITDTAQFILNDLSLSMTIPIEEARTDPYIDSYTGIPNPIDEFVSMPDLTTLPDKDGNLVTIDWHCMTYTTVNAFGEEIEEYMIDENEPTGWGGGFYDPDHEWNEERELTSVPIRQMTEQEYQVTDEFYHLRTRFQPLLFELEQSMQKRYNWLVTDFKRLSKSPVPKAFFQYVAELYLLEDSLTIEFLNFVKAEYLNYEPQDIAALVMLLPFTLSVNYLINHITDLFGDDILDSIVEPSGIHEPDDYRSQVELFHQETLKLMQAKADNKSPIHSDLFIVSAFNAIVENGLPVREALGRAYDEFRQISPSGLIAYESAIEKGLKPRQAMSAFYRKAHETGEYTPRDKFDKALSDRVILLTANSGYSKERPVTWDTLKLKAQNGELFISKDAPKKSKIWLLKKLKSLHWSKQLIASLAE